MDVRKESASLNKTDRFRQEKTNAINSKNLKAMNSIARRTLLCIMAAALSAFCGYSQTSDTSTPVRVAVYVGPGARSVGMFRWVQLVDQAPELKATFIDGASIRNGALRTVDTVVMPGGRS